MHGNALRVVVVLLRDALDAALAAMDGRHSFRRVAAKLLVVGVLLTSVALLLVLLGVTAGACLAGVGAACGLLW